VATTFLDLMRAVVEQLDDDAPRLVLADALQAAGDPRGELIAVQCELARLGAERNRLARGLKSPGSPRVPGWLADAFGSGSPERVAELRTIEKQLLVDHRETWLAGLPGGCRFERGFVEHVDGAAIRDPAMLFDRVPTLASLEIDVATTATELIAEPRMRRLRQLRLSLSGPAPDRFGLGQLLGEMAGLRELAAHDRDSDLQWCFPDAVLARIEAIELTDPPRGLTRQLCERAPRLRHLALRGRHGDDLGSTAARLEILELEQTSTDLAALAPSLQALRALRLTMTSGRRLAGVARALGDGLPALRVLDVSHTRFGPSMPELFVGLGLGSLAYLRLRECALDDGMLAPLLMSPLLGRLHHLDVRNNRITDRSLAGLGAAHRLRVLELHGTAVTRSGAARLAAQLPEVRIDLHAGAR